MRAVIGAVLVSLAGAGCGPPSWAGVYTSSGRWNLGGPLSNGRTVGDAATDLIVEQTVKLIGVPSLLEEKAQVVLDGVLRPHVKAVVDPHAPPELSPGGSVYEPLATVLAEVRVESAFELLPGTAPRSVKGVETFAVFEYTHAGTPYRLDASALAKLGAPVVAGWSGSEERSGALEVDPHEVEIQFGALVRHVADRVVDATGQATLRDKVLAAVACDRIAAAATQSGSLTITVADWSHSLTRAQLQSACDAAVPVAREQVLGLIKVDSRVELGGKVEQRGGELVSGEGFGGLIAVAPRAIAPRLGVSFTARRQR